MSERARERVRARAGGAGGAGEASAHPTPLTLPPKTAAGQQRLVVFAHLRVPTHPLVVPPLARDVQRSLQLGPQRRHAAQRASAHGEPRRSVAAGVI